MSCGASSTFLMKHSRTVSCVVMFAGLLAAPLFVSAQVVLNEVQLSPIADRFIELRNTSGSDIDLTGWYIQRKTSAGSNFDSLVTSTKFEGMVISAGGYILISRSSLPGTDILLSTLTLTESNTLRMRNASGEDVDQIEWGSVPEGQSYQRTASGSFVAGIPTPGSSAQSVVGNDSPPAEEPQNTAPPPQENTPPAPTVSDAAFPQDMTVFVDAGPSTRTVVAGADTLFEAHAWGSRKEDIPSARMVWTFGDGSTKEGHSVMHRFFYPGTYTVILETTSGVLSARDRIEVKVVPSELAIVRIKPSPEGFIEIANRGADEIDLSFWMLRAGGQTAILPRNMFAGPRRTVMISDEALKFMIPAAGDVEFLYPNGIRAASYNITRGRSSVSYTQVVPAKSTALIPAARSGAPVQAGAEPRTLASTSMASVALDVPLPEGLGASLLSTVGTSNGTAPLWPWLIAVVVLALGTIGTAFHIRRNEPALLEAPALSADDFEILEAEDEESGRKDTNPIPF